MSGLLVLAGCGDGTQTGTAGGGGNGDTGATTDAGAGPDAGGSKGSGKAGSSGTAASAGTVTGEAGAPPVGAAGEATGGMTSNEGGTPSELGGTSNQGGTNPNGGSQPQGGTRPQGGTDASGGEPAAGAPNGSAGAPDLGECDGKANGTPCGDPAATQCDGADTCNRGVCVANLTDPGTVCGKPATECDAPSECNGAGKCAIKFLPSGTACGSQQASKCDAVDSCDGAGSCEPNLADFGAPCGSILNNTCNKADFCDGDGACDSGLVAKGTACGSNADTDCDNPDTCDGSGACAVNHEAASKTCGSNADTDCDNPDTCDDAGACQANHEALGKACGSANANTCTAADTCSAAGACLANNTADATSCEDCAAGVGQCNGCSSGACANSPLCPNTSYPLTTSYTASVGTSGIMFDMSAAEDLTIRGFDVNLGTGPFTVSVYVTTSATTYVGSDANAANWTLLKTYANVTGTAAAGPTALPEDLGYTLAKGQSRGFFIVLSTGAGLRATAGVSAGVVRVSDGVLQIKEGISKSTGGFAGGAVAPRVFSGSVHYNRSITTALAGGGAINGVMFDVDSTTDARVRGVHVVPATTGSFDVQLWYRNGSYAGHENTQADWQLIDFYAKVPMVADTPLRLPIATDMIFKAGSTHGLYVTTEAAGNLRAVIGSAAGTPIVTDGRLTIKEGVGKAYSFGSTYLNRRIDATFEYDSCPAPTAQQLYLFDGGGKAGALGGRSGADAVCQTAAAGFGGLGMTSVRGFLSVSATDEVRDMPVNYGFPTGVPIKGPTGTKVADDWADLLDGSLDASLSSAQVTVASFYYTGSGSDGALDAHNCTGWTDGATTFDGHYGIPASTSTTWIAQSDATCGLAAYHLLCVGW